MRVLFIEIYSEVDSSSHFSRLGAEKRENDSSLGWLLIDEKRMFSRVRRGYEGRRFLRSVHAITYDLMYVDYDTAVQVKESFLKEANESGDYINAERTPTVLLVSLFDGDQNFYAVVPDINILNSLGPSVASRWNIREVDVQKLWLLGQLFEFLKFSGVSEQPATWFPKFPPPKYSDE